MFFSSSRPTKIDLPSSPPMWHVIPENVTPTQCAEILKAFILNRQHLSDVEAAEVMEHLRMLRASSCLIEIRGTKPAI